MTTTLFLGSQEAYEHTLTAQANAMTAFSGPNEEPDPLLFEAQGPVGVISVKGSLVDGRSGYMSYYGVVGYDDIRDALVKAVSHQGVQAILLDVSSGGGAVSGCHELAQLVGRVNEVKPVVMYTGGTCASAAYWFSAGNTKSFCAATAIVGSIGVLSIHMERTRQMEEMGVKVTVVRAGSEKALANPYEVLTDKAKAQLEDKASALYDVFIGHVAQAHGVSRATADSKYGQGREFVGAQAVDVGLVDAVGTFEDAFQAAVALGTKATNKKAPSSTRRNSTSSMNNAKVSAEGATADASMVDNSLNVQGISMKNALTQEQLAAMAAGVDLTAELDAPAAEAVAPKPELTAEEQATAVLADLNAQVGTLNTQVLALTQALAQANTDGLALKASLDASDARATSLIDIAKSGVRTMTVALGGDAKSVDTLADAASVLAKHAETSAAFKAKFKVGGVAATTVDEQPAPKKAAVNPLFAYAARSLNK